MSRFLIDNDTTYDYDTLLSAVCDARTYCPAMRADSLYSLFVNIITALVSNSPLTLIDSDLSEHETAALGIGDINVPCECTTPRISTLDDLRRAILGSSSEITIFTSGTTGQPKKITHTVESLTRTCRISDRYNGQVWGFAYNATHMAGMQVFFQALLNGNTFVNLFGKPRSRVVQLIREHSVTHLSATPTFYRLLLPADFTCPSVQRVTLGGEKSDERLYSLISAIFPEARINNIYASTEAGSLFAAKGDCFTIPEAIADKVRIVDGELLLHKSLLGKSESLSLDGDYYHTGDLIEWSDDSQLAFRFKSRKNELLNIGGYKVNPQETETAVNAIPGVRQSVVYGKANSVIGTILCCDIVKDDTCPLTELQVKALLKDKLQDFKIPRRIKFVASIQLTRSGKLKRNSL